MAIKDLLHGVKTRASSYGTHQAIQSARYGHIVPAHIAAHDLPMHLTHSLCQPTSKSLRSRCPFCFHISIVLFHGLVMVDAVEHHSVHQSLSQSVIKSVNTLSFSQLVGQSFSHSFRQTVTQSDGPKGGHLAIESVSQSVKPISLPDTIFLLISYGLIKFSLLLPLLQPVFSVSRFYLNLDNLLYYRYL